MRETKAPLSYPICEGRTVPCLRIPEMRISLGSQLADLSSSLAWSLFHCKTSDLRYGYAKNMVIIIHIA